METVEQGVKPRFKRMKDETDVQIEEGERQDVAKLAGELVSADGDYEFLVMSGEDFDHLLAKLKTFTRKELNIHTDVITEILLNIYPAQGLHLLDELQKIDPKFTKKLVYGNIKMLEQSLFYTRVELVTQILDPVRIRKVESTLSRMRRKKSYLFPTR